MTVRRLVKLAVSLVAAFALAVVAGVGIALGLLLYLPVK